MFRNVGKHKENMEPELGSSIYSTVAAIGAQLDLIPGKEVNPRVVINWLNKFREYVTTVCGTPKINLIFGMDATMGSYPVYTVPATPAADCSKSEAKIWETAYIPSSPAQSSPALSCSVFSLSYPVLA